MMQHTIEDTIIAYFDGRLNDSERAELLHRVSVSPEIREQFQQHEMLRSMTTRAARNVSVPSYLDDAVFTRIAVLAGESEDIAPAGFWSIRRMSMAAAVLALLVTGALGSYEFGGGSSGNISVANAVTPVTTTIPNVTIQNSVAEVGVKLHDGDAVSSHSAIATKRVEPFVKQPIESSAVSKVQTPTLASAEPLLDRDQNIQLIPEPRRDQPIAAIAIPGSGGSSMISLRDVTMVDESSQFELGLETASQFSVPSVSGVSPIPFLDYRFHAGYNLDSHNQIGLRIRRGSFEKFVVEANGSNPSFSEFGGSLHSVTMNSAEAYYEHVQPIDGGRFFVTAGVGGGAYTEGSLLSADIGVKIPVAEHVIANFGLALSRLHQSGTDADFLIGQSGPAIYDGSTIRNTINGRLEYGLSYRF